MDFDLEDHELLCTSVRDFCRTEVMPHAGRWDASGSVPASLFGQLGALGLMGLEVEEDAGGAALSTVAATLVIEELAAADAGLALAVSIHNALGVGTVLANGTPAQRARWLPDLAHGQRFVAWAMSEAGAGSDGAAVTTSARRDRGDWIVEGGKVLVSQAENAGAFVVLAVTDPVAEPRGLGLFLVEADRAGVEIGNRVALLGMRSAGPCDVIFRGVRVPPENLLGDAAGAWPTVRRVLDRARLDMAAIACGTMRAALAAARGYAREREQFGHPIAEFQAIQWKLADLSTNLAAARWLAMQAADLRDRGQPFGAAAARAKLFAARYAVAGCSEALQVHGGFGYTREFPVERHLRDAKAGEVVQGSAEMMRVLIAGSIRERFSDA